MSPSSRVVFWYCHSRRAPDPVFPVRGDAAGLLGTRRRGELHRQRPGHVPEGGPGQS